MKPEVGQKYRLKGMPTIVKILSIENNTVTYFFEEAVVKSKLPLEDFIIVYVVVTPLEQLL